MDDEMITYICKENRRGIWRSIKAFLKFLAVMIVILAVFLAIPSDYVPDSLEESRISAKNWFYSLLPRDEKTAQVYRLLSKYQYGRNGMRFEILLLDRNLWNHDDCKFLAHEIWDRSGRFYEEFQVSIHLQEQDYRVLYAIATFSRTRMKSYVQKGKKE